MFNAAATAIHSIVIILRDFFGLSCFHLYIYMPSVYYCRSSIAFGDKCILSLWMFDAAAPAINVIVINPRNFF